VYDKLTRVNFVLWKTQFLPTVRGAKALGIVDGTIPGRDKSLKLKSTARRRRFPTQSMTHG
jgi:hypothetical protein